MANATRVAFGDIGDDRVRHAVSVLADDQCIVPVVVGTNVELEAFADLDASNRIEVAADQDVLTALANAVRSGRADAGVSGSLSTSAAVIRAGIKTLGARRLVTGCFVIDTGESQMTFADCSVVPDPTADQLVEIAVAAGESHRAMTGDEPRVAMLSFSTAGSATHASAVKVRAATVSIRSARPDLHVDGEMQFDAATVPEIGRRKFPMSTVAGHANVLVFPTLDAGNIAYKVAERLGHARALGSYILNLQYPWVDLSRGCTVDDLVNTVRLLVQTTEDADSTKERIA